MSNSEIEAIGNLIASRLSVLYPEKWAFNNAGIISVRKREYATTRGIVSAKLPEISRAIDIWKSKEKHHPEPKELADYIEMARREIQNEIDAKAAKRALAPPNPYVDSEKQKKIEALVEKYKQNNPGTTIYDIVRAAIRGEFKC